MTNFQSFGLPQSVLNSLDRMKFVNPTPVQEQTIPVALEGKDVLGSAETGTGKTAAFLIPLVVRLMQSNDSAALVMAPTRELAIQINEMLLKILGKDSALKSVVLIGGDSMHKQLRGLNSKPRLIVGTPGRINDHLRRGSLKLNKTTFLVLDEIDRMLDMGFEIQLEDIISKLPTERQTLMFSATLPLNIVKLSLKYSRDAVRISLGATNKAKAKIKQENIQVSEVEKYEKLVDQIKQREGSIIVFVNTKHGAEKLVDKLLNNSASEQILGAEVFHGGLNQSRRERVIRGFRNSKYRVLVATDVAARGLDVPHIEHVINYDLPQCPEDYIHRIGRTGRAGAEGSAVNLIAKSDNAKWKAINRLLNADTHLDTDPSAFRKPSGGGRSGGRSFGGERRHSDKPRSQRRSFGDKVKPERNYGDKPFGRSDKGFSSRSRDEGGYSDKPRGERRSFGDKAKPERNYGDKPFGAKKAFSGKPRDGRSFAGRSRKKANFE